MAEEDNFDIDIYGDGGEEYQEEGQVQDQSSAVAAADSTAATSLTETENGDYSNQDNAYDDHDHPTPDTSLPKPPIPVLPGTKRKDGPDDRHVDPGATNALFVGELSWWTTDDEIRGWAKESGCEDELKEVTFNEQKVNGKSKGQVYLLLESSQASTAIKHKIDQHSESGKYRTKFSVSYTNPLQNPFKTLPKDGPQRTNNNRNTSGNFGSSNNNHQSGFNPNYRGRGRGNFNSGGNFNRGGFQSGATNFNNQMNPNFQQNTMGGMPAFGGAGAYGGRGGFQGGRGGMGMRGGRGGGGMQPNMGMGMPMAGGMMPNMAMGMPMAGGMGMPGAFQAPYSPGFGYTQNTPAADPGWSGGPNKRPRQE